MEIPEHAIEEIAAMLRAAGSGRQEPEYFREMARELFEAAGPLVDIEAWAQDAPSKPETTTN